MIGEMRARMSEHTRDVRARLDRLEQGVTRLAEGPDRAALVETVQALRETVGRLEGVERDERHQLGARPAGCRSMPSRAGPTS